MCSTEYMKLTSRHLREGNPPSVERCLDLQLHNSTLVNLRYESFPSQLGYLSDL
uniref:Uncharacterized protein n=1 Tax=Arundo donax TaxID=35708 RepID=A0A0A8XY67_ARUDO